MSLTTLTDSTAGNAGIANVLVVGFGVVGKAVLDGLLAPVHADRISAYALVRPASLLDATKRAVVDGYKAKGVRVLEGDLSGEPATLAQTLSAAHINTVISTVGFGQYLLQLRLLEAAKTAGVKHFIPSEFAFDIPLVGSNTTLEAVLGPKLVVQRAVISSGLDYTFVCTGGFTEYMLSSPLFGVDLRNEVVTAPGSFSNCMTFTSIVDISNLVADAVINPQARNKTIYLGEPLSYQQIADTIDSVSSKPLERRVRTSEEALTILKADPADYKTRFIPVVDAQKGVWWPVEQTYAFQHKPGYSITTLQQLVQQAVMHAQSGPVLDTVQSKAATRASEL